MSNSELNKIILSDQELESISKDDLIQLWKKQLNFVDTIESRSPNEQISTLKQQQADAAKRESVVMARLASKEHELQDLAAQISEMKQSTVPGSSQLRNALLDPAVNLVVEAMRKQLDTTKDKLEQTQNELNAWKFTRDSQTGKQLMAKCRQLLQENEELGRQICAGRVARLEGDIALEKALVKEMRSSQRETDEFLLEVDDEAESMQMTVYVLQRQLRCALAELAGAKGTTVDVERARIEALAKEVPQSVTHTVTPPDKPASQPPASALVNYPPDDVSQTDAKPALKAAQDAAKQVNKELEAKAAAMPIPASVMAKLTAAKLENGQTNSGEAKRRTSDDERARKPDVLVNGGGAVEPIDDDSKKTTRKRKKDDDDPPSKPDDAKKDRTKGGKKASSTKRTAVSNGLTTD